MKNNFEQNELLDVLNDMGIGNFDTSGTSIKKMTTNKYHDARVLEQHSRLLITIKHKKLIILL